MFAVWAEQICLPQDCVWRTDMHPYIEWLSNATAKELEESPTRAVQRAIKELHAAGIPAIGASVSGELIEVLPDGTERPYIPKKVPS